MQVQNDHEARNIQDVTNGGDLDDTNTEDKEDQTHSNSVSTTQKNVQANVGTKDNAKAKPN